MHGMGDQQPPQDGVGIGVHMHFEIGDGEGDDQVVHDVLAHSEAHGSENATRITL